MILVHVAATLGGRGGGVGSKVSCWRMRCSWSKLERRPRQTSASYGVVDRGLESVYKDKIVLLYFFMRSREAVLCLGQSRERCVPAAGSPIASLPQVPALHCAAPVFRRPKQTSSRQEMPAPQPIPFNYTSLIEQRLRIATDAASGVETTLLERKSSNQNTPLLLVDCS